MSGGGQGSSYFSRSDTPMNQSINASHLRHSGTDMDRLLLEAGVRDSDEVLDLPVHAGHVIPHSGMNMP